MRQDDEHRLPDRQRFDQPIIIRDGLLGKIGMGLFCSSIVAIVMNFAGIRWVVVHLFALFLSLFGKGEYVVHPADAVKAEAKEQIEKAKEKYGIPSAAEVKDAARQQAGGILPPVIIGGLKSEAEREADRLRKEQKERNTLLARADIVKLACDPEWTLEKLKSEVEQAERQIREAPERKILYDKADKLGLEVDPACDLKTLRDAVWGAEEEARLDAEYQAKLREWERQTEDYTWQLKHGPNSRCPRCGNAMRINPAWAKKDLQCPKCRYFFNGYRALALWVTPKPPKEPQPPKKKPPGWFKSTFG
jgi:hypothetical protein